MKRLQKGENAWKRKRDEQASGKENGSEGKKKAAAATATLRFTLMARLFLKPFVIELKKS
jgi:hypothetical protein